MEPGSGSIEFEVPGGALVALALALALALVTLAGIRRVSGEASRARVLVAMRIATAVMAFLVASQPIWSGEQIERRDGRLGVLFDLSRSTSVRADGERTRADQAQALARRWASRQRSAAPDVYGFGRGARPLRLEALARELPALEDDTQIGAALLEAVGGAEGRELGAVVIVSDGADLGRDAVGTAERLGVRVHTIALGAEGSLRDDAIAELRADRVGFLRRQARAQVTVRRLGAGAAAVPVTLSDGTRTIYETSVIVPADGEATVDLPFIPDRLGRKIYRVSIPTSEDDAVPQNNTRSFLVQVARDNLRVLLVAGQPSWDQRFLRAFLSRDPSTDLISFFILRNTSDMTMADSDELALIPFPTDELFNEHLGSFDVVLMQNFEYEPYQMAIYLPRIREYVMRGGSLVMIGGPLSFSNAGYAETPIADVLPVTVLPRGTPETQAITTDRFRPRLGQDALRHPVVGLLPDPRTNVEAWASLAPLEGLNVVAEVRPNGQRLLEHPSRVDRRGAPLPVLVAGTAGPRSQGRVLALMTDTSWRWGLTTAGATGDASAYERFWDRALRWLAHDPALEPARLTTDRQTYGTEGSSVRVDAALSDPRYVPLAGREIALSLRLDGTTDSGHEVARFRTDANGNATASFAAPSVPGGYRLGAHAPGAPDEVLAEEVFVVEAGGQELADPRARPELLAELAQRTGGSHFLRADDAPDLSELDASRVRSLGIVTHRPFSSWWAFALLIGLFGAEWVIRRRWGAR